MPSIARVKSIAFAAGCAAVSASRWVQSTLVTPYAVPGCHRMEPYCSADPQAHLRLAQTERLAKMVLCLPTGSAISSAEITAICALIEFVVKHAQSVKQR